MITPEHARRRRYLTAIENLERSHAAGAELADVILRKFELDVVRPDAGTSFIYYSDTTNVATVDKAIELIKCTLTEAGWSIKEIRGYYDVKGTGDIDIKLVLESL